ncbi:MAG: glutamate--tRNA ligase, partial [Gemmatimonadota bacterium]
ARRLRESGIEPTIRFRTRAGPVRVRDLLKGELSFEGEGQGDFVILKSGGGPTYNFAVVADDLAMKITHVIRGIGHLANTPRQVLLYEALEAQPPVFVHIPHVLDPDGEPLSKRRGAPTLAEYEREGYHPDAVVNYLSLLSWSSPTGDEVLERERLIREIDLTRLGASDVRVDPQKLRWLSGKHIQRMPAPDLARRLAEHAGPAGAAVPAEAWVEIADALRDRLTTFSEVRERLPQFFPPEPLDYPPAIAQALAADGVASLLEAAADALRSASWTKEGVLAALKAAGRARGASGRALYRPIRLALTGREQGPELADILRVQGREVAVRRLRSAAGLGAAGRGGELGGSR